MPDDEISKHEILRRIRADLDKTLEAHKKAVSLRAKKIEQDMEQIGVYFEILEREINSIKLSPKKSKKIEKVLSWKASERPKNHGGQQEQIEDHFIEIQKVLVNLISRRFKD